MKKISYGKWLTGIDNSNFAKLLVLYDDDTYEQIKVSISGQSKITMWYWNEPCYEAGDCDGDRGYRYVERTFRSVMAISTIKGMTAEEGQKYIAEKEMEWQSLVEKEKINYKAMKKKERINYMTVWHCLYGTY